MEGNSEADLGEKTTGGRSKTPGLPASTRLQRNQAEKQRRDRLNGYISELANLVPMVSNASKPLDKVSILRLSAAQMRLNFSCLNPKKFKCKPLTLPPSVISYLDVIEKSIGGFILVTTFSGCIVFCSKSIEDYVGYQNIDVMGNSVYSYIHSGDVTYFEKKVNSVTNSQRKSSKKKTKVIKAHMQQRPLPRSNDIRYRKMIFKISVHLNDQNESNSNGHSHLQSKTKKAGRLKDFGSSAVVLMFIEPVRLEPEIDISYIESHQDAYFTMHGLQGEIIYADQRISSITGYMPHDVQGTSAYQYICSSDVPIALFAQKAMFTSNDGTGVIVYRLRIRDMRFIYLQSSGQIAYKDSTNDISHFVCFNKLLSDEEGSQELKKFQQRFAPQIMEAKLLQGKSSDSNALTQNVDASMDHTLSLIDSPSLIPDEKTVASQMNSFQSKDNSSEGFSGVTDQTSSEGCVSPTSSAIVSCSVHSSEGHSLTSPVSDVGSNSMVSDYSGLQWSFDTSNERFGDHTRLKQEQHERRSSLNSDCSSHTTISYESGNERNFRQQIENNLNGFDHSLNVDAPRLPESSVNGSFMTYQKNPCASQKLQNKTLLSANNSLRNSITVNDILEDSLNSRSMELDFEYTFSQKNVSPNVDTPLNSANAYPGQSSALMTNGHHEIYVNYNGAVPYGLAAEENRHFVTSKNLQLLDSNSATFNSLHLQPMNFTEEHVPCSNDLPSFSGLYEVSPTSSLPNISNHLTDISGVSNAVNSSSFSPYENGSYTNRYRSKSGVDYNVGSTGVSIGRDVYKSKSYNGNIQQVNGCHSSGHYNVISDFSSGEINSVKATALNQTAMNPVKENAYCRSIPQYPRTENLKPPVTAHENGSSDIYPSTNGLRTVLTNFSKPEIRSGVTENMDLDLNKELYNELDMFFKNLPHTPQDPVVTQNVSKYDVANNSISSGAKTNYHL